MTASITGTAIFQGITTYPLQHMLSLIVVPLTHYVPNHGVQEIPNWLVSISNDVSSSFSSVISPSPSSGVRQNRFFLRWVKKIIYPVSPLDIFRFFSLACEILLHIILDVLIGRPGYALFEATKRFLQAQGIFGASTVVLFVAAPINAVLYLRNRQIF